VRPGETRAIFFKKPFAPFSFDGLNLPIEVQGIKRTAPDEKN
jgi:hypothetical protein